MNSRERILSVFKCEMPDKIPVSLNTLSTGFIRANDNLAYDLIKHTDPNIWVYLDLNFLGFEIIFGKNIYENSKIEKDKNTTKITIHTPKGDLVQVTEHRPESDWVTEYFFKDIEDVNKFYSFEYIPFKKDEIDISEYLYWDKIIGNQGIVSVVIYDAPIMLYSLLGPKNYYFSLKDNFKLVKEFTAEAEIRIENFINTLFFLFTDKLLVILIAGPEALTKPMTSNYYYNELVLPNDGQLIKLIHQKGGIANIHQHGMVSESLNSLIKMNPNAISPFEAPPGGDMELKEVKEKLSGKICVIGNLDDLQVLSNKDKKEIQLKTFKLIRDVAENGGFILGGTDSSVLTDEMLKSFILMGKISDIYGQYPININKINEKINILE